MRVRVLDAGSAIAFLLLITLIYAPAISGLAPGLSVAELGKVLSQDFIRRAFIFSLTQASISAALATAIGGIAAIALTTISSKAASIIRALALLSFMAPPMIVVSGFTALYGRGGILSSAIPPLRALGEGFGGVVAAHVFYNIPLAMNLVYSTLVAVPSELVDAVRIYSGGRLWPVIKRVVIPYASPALIASYALTFIYCFASFAIPLTLGGPAYSTLEVYIYYFYRMLFDYGAAAATATLQLAVLAAATVLFTLAYTRLPPPPIGRRATAVLPGRRYVKAASVAVLVAVAAYLTLPLMSVIIKSFLEPGNGFTLRGYERVFSPSFDQAIGTSGLRVIGNTLYFAMMTALVALTVGSFLAFTGGAVADALLTTLLAISPLTLAMGLLNIYGGLLPAPILIIFAHTIAALPLVIKSLRLGFLRVGKEIADAARVLGARGLLYFLRIVAPLSRSSYFVAAALAIVVSLGEFGATYLIARPEFYTLGIVIYSFRGVRDWPASYAASTVLLAMSASLLLLLSRKLERWM